MCPKSNVVNSGMPSTPRHIAVALSPQGTLAKLMELQEAQCPHWKLFLVILADCSFRLRALSAHVPFSNLVRIARSPKLSDPSKVQLQVEGYKRHCPLLFTAFRISMCPKGLLDLLLRFSARA